MRPLLEEFRKRRNYKYMVIYGVIYSISADSLYMYINCFESIILSIFGMIQVHYTADLWFIIVLFLAVRNGNGKPVGYLH